MATKRKILIAEDEKPMAKALELKLTNQGFDVTPAYDGQEAVDALDKDKFDLVILDLIMPKVDGFGVLQHMLDNKIKTPTIVASNLSQPEDEEKVKKMGAVDFFVKSNTPITNLVDHVKEALEK